MLSRQAARFLRREESGQALIFMMFLSLLVLVTAAIAVDVGMWMRDRRHAQNMADAVVLAAVQELPLPGESSARAVALEWANKNNVSQLRCCEFEDRDGDGRADTVRAWTAVNSRSLFARLLGFGDPVIWARAAAMRARAYGSSVMPWAVFCTDRNSPTCNLDPNQRFTFFWDDRVSPGNWGALAVDGNGQSDYKNSIQGAGGSRNVYCQEGKSTSDCPDVASPTKPGQMGQNTCDALYNRVRQWGETDVPRCGTNSNATVACDAASKAEALQDTKNPTCGGRKVLIPLTQEFDMGGRSDPVTIYYVGTFYIAGWKRNNPWGRGDLVWGYWLRPEDCASSGADCNVDPAWTLLVDPDPEHQGDGAFAPLVAILIE